MSKRLKKLQDRRAALVQSMRATLDVADKESRDLSAEEQTKYDAHKTELAQVAADIADEQALVEVERAMTAVQDGNAAAQRVRVEVLGDRADTPFKSLGEQLSAIVSAGSPDGHVDPRLRIGAGPTGGNTTTGSDGGYLVQKDFATELMSSGIETGVLSSRCSETEISANADGLEVPYAKNDDRRTGARWGGVRVYRRAEAETVDPSKVKLEKWSLDLEDLMGLAYVTDRLMKDGSAMASVFEEAFNEEFGFQIDDEIVNGNGVGRMLGFLNSDALVTVAKKDGQAAGSVVVENILEMWARLPARFRKDAAWLINQELEPQFPLLTIGAGAGTTPVFMPPGGLKDQPYSTIYGAPVIPIEQAAVPGTVGDISLVSLKQYKIIRKGGTERVESIHVRFVYGERAFRWTVRINGAPKLKAPITPAKGAKQLSPFIALAQRA